MTSIEAVRVLERALGRFGLENVPMPKDVDRALRCLKGEAEPMSESEAKELVYEELASLSIALAEGDRRDRLVQASFIMHEKWRPA